MISMKDAMILETLLSLGALLGVEDDESFKGMEDDDLLIMAAVQQKFDKLLDEQLDEDAYNTACNGLNILYSDLHPYIDHLKGVMKQYLDKESDVEG